MVSKNTRISVKLVTGFSADGHEMLNIEWTGRPWGTSFSLLRGQNPHFLLVRTDGHTLNSDHSPSRSGRSSLSASSAFTQKYFYGNI